MQWCYERDSPVLWIIPRHKLLPALAAALGCRTGRHPLPDIGGTIGHWIEFPVVALIVKVILVVLSQFLKAFRTNYFLRVVPTKWRFFDIFSDMLSGIRTLFHTLSAILSGIQSGISSGFFCGWGPASNTLIIKLNMFVVVVVVVVVAAVAVAALCCCCWLLLLLSFLLPLQLFSQSHSGQNIVIFLKLLEQTKNTGNTDVFCASEAQSHGIYDVVCLW